MQLAGLGHLSHAGAEILEDTSPEPTLSNRASVRPIGWVHPTSVRGGAFESGRLSPFRMIPLPC